MEATRRCTCLLYRNRNAKLYVSRIFSRTLRGTRLIIPKKISREGERALDNILCTSDSKPAAVRKTNTSDNEIDYLKKYEIGGEIASFYKKMEDQNSAEKSLPKPIQEKSSPIYTAENQYDLLSEKVTPLYKLPYDMQLEAKYRGTLSLLKKIGHHLKGSAKLHIGSDSLPCPLALVVPSPVIENFRNKDELSIHSGIDGNPKTVGFFLESKLENSDTLTLCVNIDQVVVIREEHKTVAKDFENYIRQSPLPPQQRFSEEGYWKNIIIRSNSQKDVMVIVIMHPQNLSEEELEAEKHKLKEYFTSEDRKGYNLKSLYFQACRHTKCTHAVAPFELLYGEPYICESLNGFQFQISPEPFFQTNTAATESLLKSVSKLCKFSPSTVLLDVCCGSGAMGISFSPYVKKTIGIDISPEAIKDAKANAKLNNIENAEFHCGTIEKLFSKVLDDIYADELIAILNPPGQGLSATALQILRQCKYLKKVVYVSCKPEAAIENYVDLCRSHLKGVNIGKPFLPMMAIPVDMFPQTKHLELVILFQRL